MKETSSNLTIKHDPLHVYQGGEKNRMNKIFKLFVAATLVSSAFASVAFANTTTTTPATTTTTPATTTTTPATTTTTPATTTTTPATTTTTPALIDPKCLPAATPAATTPAATTPATTTPAATTPAATTPATTTPAATTPAATTPAATTPAATTPAATTPAATTPATDVKCPVTALEKFEVLKTGGIFTGFEDGSAGLNQDMTRAQAAAIIARLLKLKENADAASVYKDLADAKWAAGFIGAVTPKYMQGITNGKFNPSGKITVEQLATVMVRVLDLKIDEKATVVGASSWAQPYVAAALAANLMKSGSDYKTPAIRELLVETIYSAAVVISKPVVPPEPPKPVATLEIEGVSSYSQTLVAVEVKTELKAAPDVKEFKVKDDAGKDVAVSAVALKNGGKTVVLTVAQMTAQKINTLTFGGKDYKFVAVPTETNKPEVKSALATKNTAVKVEFNEKVDDNALTITNYTIAGLQVLKAEYDGTNRDVVILTTAAQTQGTIYTVSVANVTDLAGNVINADKKEAKFGGLAPDTAKPKLSTAVAKTNKSVELQFDDASDLDEKTALDIANYTIAGLQVLKAEFVVTDDKADKKKVLLTTAAQTQGTIYKVVVANVKDEVGNVIDDSNKERQFGGLAPDTVKPIVEVAAATTNTAVVVTFTEEVNKESAETIANYTIAGLTITAAKLETNKKSVKLTTSAQTAGTIYTVVVANVKDISDNVIGSDNNKKQFGGIAVDATKPEVHSAIADGPTKVKVTFTEVVDETTAKQTWNYYLGTELGYPSSVAKDTVDTTGKVWVLTTASQKRVTYTLDVTGVQDLSGNVLNEDKDEAKFAGNGSTDTTAPKVSSAIALNKQEIKIMFDEELSDTGTGVTKVEAGDFSFTYVGGAPDVGTTNSIVGTSPTAFVVADDKRSVTVTFAFADTSSDVRTTAGGAIYRVTVTNVSDAVGNPIVSANHTADFAGTSQSNDKPKITFVQALDNKTLQLTFNEKVKWPVAPAPGGLVYTTDFSIATLPTGLTLSSQTLAKDGKSALLYFEGTTETAKFAAGALYTLKITDAGVVKIKDEFNVHALETKEIQFVGAGNNPSALSFTALAVNQNTLDLTFNNAIDQRTTVLTNTDIVEKVTDNNNVEVIPSNQVASKVKLIRKEGDDGKKLRIFFDGTPFVDNKLYRISLVEANIKDNNNQALVTANENSLFQAIAVVNEKPKMVSAVAKGNKIEVTFSEALKVTNAEPSDFTFSSDPVENLNGVTSPTGIAIKSGSDNKVVELTLGGAQLSGKLITIAYDKTKGSDTNSSITDEAGVGELDSATTVQYVSSETTVKISSVAVQNSKTLRVTFTKPLQEGNGMINPGVALVPGDNIVEDILQGTTGQTESLAYVEEVGTTNTVFDLYFNGVTFVANTAYTLKLVESKIKSTDNTTMLAAEDSAAAPQLTTVTDYPVPVIESVAYGATVASGSSPGVTVTFNKLLKTTGTTTLTIDGLTSSDFTITGGTTNNPTINAVEIVQTVGVKTTVILKLSAAPDQAPAGTYKLNYTNAGNASTDTKFVDVANTATPHVTISGTPTP